MNKLRLVLKITSDFLINVLIGAFVVLLVALAFYIYLNQQDFILGELSAYALLIVVTLVLYVIGRGVR